MVTSLKHQPGLSLILKLTLFLTLFSPLLSKAQISGRAPVTTPTGGFNIDGYVSRNNVGIFTGGDWRASTEALRLLNITSGSGITSVVAPVDASATAFIRDPWNTTADKIFTGGSKFDDGVTALKWSTGKATAKNDIHNGMFHIGIDANGDRWLLMAGDRYSNDGTSYIDFEFLQRTIRTDIGGGFSYLEPANDPDLPALGGGKSIKDFVLSMEYSNGGSVANVFLYVWEDLGNNKFGYVEKTIPTGISYAQTNIASVPVDIGAFDLLNYAPYSFVEAAVNISELYRDVINNGGYNDCSGAVYKSMFIKTKASDAPTAALKDFIEPQSINLVFDEISFSYPPVCTNVASGTITPTISGGTPEDPSYSSSSPNLTIDGSTGAILTAVAAGTYTVTINFQLGSCEKTEYASVVVTQLPSATFSYATPFCATATNISPTLSAGASYGTFSASPTLSGLNASTGEISAFAGANTYTITNTITGTGGCPTVSHSQQIVVTALPNASFSYPQPSYCIATGTITPTIINTTPPGSFTSNPAGLALTGTTGVIDLGASSAGTYTVTYTIPAGGGCPVVPYSRQITLNNTPNLNLEGDGTDEICQGTTTASILYSSPFGSPDKYSIDFVSGIPDITDAAFAGTLGIPNIAANINAGTYTGTLTVETPAGCISAPFAVYVVVNASTAFQLSTEDPLTVCPFETIQVCGPANPDYEYLWSNGETTQCASYTLGICGSTITPTLYLTDENGCQSQATLTFLANDTEDPIFTNLPPNVTISDGDPLPTGEPTVTDNCMENIQVSKNDVTEEKNCIKVIKRTFTATDECGNSVSYTQLIIVKDDTPPVITNCGTVTTNLNCGAALPAPGTNLPTVEAGASLYSTDKVVAALNGCGTHNIERVWTIIDAAGNTSTCSQFYNYQLPPPAQNSTLQKDQISTTAKPTGPGSIRKQLQIKAYPNPYSNLVNFSFTPNKSGYAVLDLVDLTGRRVATVFKGNVTEGKANTVSYENKSGIKVPLIYRLTIGSEIKSGKILPSRN